MATDQWLYTQLVQSGNTAVGRSLCHTCKPLDIRAAQRLHIRLMLPNQGAVETDPRGPAGAQCLRWQCRGPAARQPCLQMDADGIEW